VHAGVALVDAELDHVGNRRSTAAVPGVDVKGALAGGEFAWDRF
jgi:hypothetical protein